MANTWEDRLALVEGWEPQRKYSFVLELPFLSSAQDQEMLTLAVKSCFLPQGSNEEIELPFMNSKIYFAGKYEEAEGTVTFVDFCNQQVADVLLSWRYSVFNPMTGQAGLARDYKKDAYIKLYGPPLDAAASPTCR